MSNSAPGRAHDQRWAAAIPESPCTHDCLSELKSWVDGVADGELTHSPDPRTAAALLLDVVNGSCVRAAASTHPATTVAPQTLLHALVGSWT
jgi:hypothetical protein